MGLDRRRWGELIVGLEGVEVLEVARGNDGRLWVVIETTDRLAWCSVCGVRAVVKDRPRAYLADLAAFGSPVTVLWVKRRWACSEPLCEKESWTEDRADVAPAGRPAMTTRAGLWATREVGAHVHTVSYVAGQLGGGVAHGHGRRAVLG
ncbi:MAG: transposase family protein [Acidimicrobiia bacterium]